MRICNWLSAHLQHILDGLVGGVRDIHHHPDAVHFPHQFAPERAESTPAAVSGAAVAHLIVSAVGQRYIAHSPLFELCEQLEGLLDSRGILNGKHDRSQA